MERAARPTKARGGLRCAPPSLQINMQHFFATCARGIEPILAGELRDLGAAHVEAGRGGVAFGGDRTLLYRANLCLRTAIRVLHPILQAPVTSPEELYDAVGGVDWSRYIPLNHE